MFNIKVTKQSLGKKIHHSSLAQNEKQTEIMLPFLLIIRDNPALWAPCTQYLYSVYTWKAGIVPSSIV